MKERIKTVRSSSLPPHCKFYLRIKFKLRPKWVLLSLLCCTEDDSFWQQGEWLPLGLKTEFQIPLCKINSKNQLILQTLLWTAVLCVCSAPSCQWIAVVWKWGKTVWFEKCSCTKVSLSFLEHQEQHLYHIIATSGWIFPVILCQQNLHLQTSIYISGQ